MQSQSEVKASFKLLVFASLLTLALWFIPFAGVVTYPIRLFVTYLHEIGHALAALATFGGVNRVALDWSGSGVTFTQGGLGLLISSAGYLTTTVYGSALLLFLRRERNAKVAAIGTGALLLLITGLFGGNIVAWLAGLVFGAGCLLLGMKGRPKLVHFCMSFLAVQCLLNAFYDLRTVLYLSAFDPAFPTDARNMSQATGGFLPPVVWAAGWAVVSIGVVAGTLLIYYHSLRERASLPDTNSPSLIADHSARAAHPNI
ncbi:MAG TPA: M50 family metallopeptidase [Blastocatellia bacterium]|nr:M50 family metallopeptidase [Blastocatellia bacterium]